MQRYVAGLSWRKTESLRTIKRGRGARDLGRYSSGDYAASAIKSELLREPFL